MKLGDIELTDAQAAALVGRLDELVAETTRRAEKARADQEREEWRERCYERLAHLARVMAQMTGPVPGIPPYELARAAWRGFDSAEGFFSRYNVHERFDPSDDWADDWEHAYLSALTEVEAGKLPRITVDEAMKLVGPTLDE